MQPLAVHVQRCQRTGLDETRAKEASLAGFSAQSGGGRIVERRSTQEIQRRGDAVEEFTVSGEAVKSHQQADAVAGTDGGDRRRFEIARLGGREVEIILVGPTRCGGSLLKGPHTIHGPNERLHGPGVAQHIGHAHQDLDVVGSYVVVERDAGRVVGCAVGVGMVVHQRPALGPSSDGILAFEDHADGFVERRFELRIVLFKVDAHEEIERRGRHIVVERGIAVIVAVLTHAPGVTADGLEPPPFGSRSGQVELVVPAPAGKLSPDQDAGRAHGHVVIKLVTRGVVGVDHQLPHLGGSLLDPHHRGVGFQFTPAARKVGGVVPDEPALGTHTVVHEAGGLLHGRKELSGVVFRRGGRSGEARRQDQRQ